MKSLTKTEFVLLIAGVGLLGICAIAYLTGLIQSRMALNKFHRQLWLQNEAQDQAVKSGKVLDIDFSLWSEKRIRDYEASLVEKFDSPVAVLVIQRIRLEVPVFDGIDDLTLNRGAGRIIGTSRPGEKGNVGIAGHRDGFFRRLKDVAVGDELELETKGGSWKYIVDSIQIVDRDDLSVLTTGATPSVTLVTCYPFYFIGSAPKRYIVHASLQAAPAVVSRSATAQFTGNH